MALQLSVGVRNAMLDAFETTVGTTPYFDIRTSTQPANCASADAGTILAHIQLPSDWLNAASAGAITMKGSWTDDGVDDGVAGHFRIKDSAGTTCHMQGSVTATGGGGQLELDNVNIANGQSVTITTFTLTAPNA